MKDTIFLDVTVWFDVQSRRVSAAERLLFCYQGGTGGVCSDVCIISTGPRWGCGPDQHPGCIQSTTAG